METSVVGVVKGMQILSNSVGFWTNRASATTFSRPGRWWILQELGQERQPSLLHGRPGQRCSKQCKC